jgi:hypothetical protein
MAKSLVFFQCRGTLLGLKGTERVGQSGCCCRMQRSLSLLSVSSQLQGIKSWCRK